MTGLIYIWFLPSFQVTPFIYCNYLSRRGSQSFTRDLSSFFFIFWRELHWIALVPSFPVFKTACFSLFQVTPIQSNLEQKSLLSLIAKWTKNNTISKCGICSAISYYALKKFTHCFLFIYFQYREWESQKSFHVTPFDGSPKGLKNSIGHVTGT